VWRAAVHAERGFLFSQHFPHGRPIGFRGFLCRQGYQSQLQHLAKLDQGIGLLHKGRGGKILRINQRYGRRFEDDGANLWSNADQLKRFERLNRLPNASSTNRKLFSKLFFGWQALARLYLPFSDQIEDVSDYLGSNRLSANQAVPPELLTVYALLIL
jgi:hypothetical protein